MANWHRKLYDLTPVERLGDYWFKREDKFAPMGSGGVNGSKMRQAVWLIHEALRAGATGVVGGAVAGSPQHPIMAAIAAHYGVPCVTLSGARPAPGSMVQAAVDLGAQVRQAPCGYAKALEHRAFQLGAEELKSYFVMETNITVAELRNPPERIEAFHRVGSEQVRNIPDTVETLLIPAGSCNSVVSVLYGIWRFRPRKLKRVVLLGVGNHGSKNPEYVYDRLAQVERGGGGEGLSAAFAPRFLHDAGREPEGNFRRAPWALVHANVNNGCGACEKCAGSYTTYGDLMPYEYQGLRLHPRYEGKTFQFMDDHPKLFSGMRLGEKLYWVIGGQMNA